MRHLSYPMAQDTVGAALGRAARKFRHRPALTYSNRVWSFAALDAASRRVGAMLLDAGCKPGDRVAAFGRNSDGYLLAWLGCVQAGLVHVPINYSLFGAELHFILNHAGASVLLTDADKLDAVRVLSPLPDLQGLGTFTGGLDLDVLEAARGNCPTEQLYPPDGAALAQIQYTSGTTSAPKGAMMHQRAILFEYLSCMHALDFSDQDRCLAALPLYHTAQMHAFLMPQLLAGSHTYLIEKPLAADVFAHTQEHAITSFFAPPTVWISLLRDPGFDRFDLTSLRKIYYGASIMPAPILAELQTRLPGAGVYNVYGQSEIGPVATVLSPAEHADRPTSVGMPVVNVETRIVDEDMNDVAVGTQGEIVHRSPQLLSGYWRQPELSVDAFKGGWFHSGDVGIADDDGYLYVVDRVRDVINTGGVLVAGREVEDALFSHPLVAEAAVIGLPDPQWIESVTAIVVLRSSAEIDGDTLIEFVKERIARHKVPKRIFFTNELPRNAAGKILKRELRLMYSDA
jgi:fatty-acyl-CoA synthase